MQQYAPEVERRTRWFRRRGRQSWRVDETYIRVKGEWKYLYRALDSFGNTIDFFLSARRNIYATKRFLGKALRSSRLGTEVSAINTDRNPTYTAAIAALRKEETLHEATEHRQAKYLNNGIECDHGKIKRLLKPGLASETSGLNCYLVAIRTAGNKGGLIAFAARTDNENAAINRLYRTGPGFVDGDGYFVDVRPDHWLVDRGHNQHGKRTAFKPLLLFHVLVARKKHVEAFGFD